MAQFLFPIYEKDPDSMVRFQALTSMGWFPEDSERTLKIFLNPKMPVWGRFALVSGLTNAGKHLFKKMKAIVNEEKPYFGSFALVTIGLYSRGSGKWILPPYLKHPKAHIRCSALVGLLFDVSSTYLAGCKKLLKDPNPNVRMAAAALLFRTLEAKKSKNLKKTS